MAKKPRAATATTAPNAAPAVIPPIDTRPSEMITDSNRPASNEEPVAEVSAPVFKEPAPAIVVETVQPQIPEKTVLETTIEQAVASGSYCPFLPG